MKFNANYLTPEKEYLSSTKLGWNYAKNHPNSNTLHMYKHTKQILEDFAQFSTLANQRVVGL